jgi:AraC family transcriptional regulator, regulatory protein of adaptative response / methylphosphotriester-DNA alkyltransferase methyltransferase
MQTTITRPKELTKQYIELLDAHIAELQAGMVDTAMAIGDFAEKLFVHPVHLSNTIKEVTGQSTCDLYEERLLAAAQHLLRHTDKNIGDIAIQLTYDPSNFTKFFKAYTGLTPKRWRQQYQNI